MYKLLFQTKQNSYLKMYIRVELKEKSYKKFSVYSPKQLKTALDVFTGTLWALNPFGKIIVDITQKMHAAVEDSRY